MENIASDYSGSYGCSCPVSHLGNQRFKNYTDIYIHLIGRFVYFPMKGNYEEGRVKTYLQYVGNYLRTIDFDLGEMFLFIWKRNGHSLQEKMKVSFVANLYVKSIYN